MLVRVGLWVLGRETRGPDKNGFKGNRLAGVSRRTFCYSGEWWVVTRLWLGPWSRATWEPSQDMDLA